ncbi:MAG: hypothetical protein AB1468_06635 [Candidatus Micrarchaeota archaeon]
METKEYIKMSEEAEKLRDRGIEINCRVENGAIRITAGRAPQAGELVLEIPGVRYI